MGMLLVCLPQSRLWGGAVLLQVGWPRKKGDQAVCYCHCGAGGGGRGERIGRQGGRVGGGG